MTDPQCQVGIVRSVGSSIGSGTGVVIVQVTDEYSSSEAAKAAEAHASDIDYCAAPGEPPTPKSGQWRPYRGAPVPEGVTVLTHQSEVLGQPTLLFRSQHGRTQTRALLGWDSESTPDSIEEMVQQVASALEARA